MPRTTHPVDRHQHQRGETRRQRLRHNRRLWREGKREMEPHALEIASAELPVGVAQTLGQDGPVVFLHPEVLRRVEPGLRSLLKPFTRARSGFAVPHGHLDPPTHEHRLDRERARSERTWRRAELTELPVA